MSQKSKRKKKKKKAAKGTLLRGLFKIVFSLLIVGAIGGSAAVTAIVMSAPEIDPANLYSLLTETSVIYDDQGNVLEQIDTAEPRTNVSYQDMPENLRNAFLAVEDKTFFKHNGFNFKRLAGAVVGSFKKNTNIRGTSTITQQLARNLYLTKERSMVRKIREAYYTVQLEKHLSKEQILEAYLNTIYLGYNAYGVQAASQAYFSKNVQELTLEECATFAAIPQSTAKYAPLKRYENEDVDPENPDIIIRGDLYTVVYDERFVDRQHLVLDLMLEQGLITEEAYNHAYSVYMKTAMNPSAKSLESVSSYFTDYLKSSVINDLMEAYHTDEGSARNMLYSGGLRIYSTMDVRLQQIVENEFQRNDRFPKVTNLSRDKNGNILDSNKEIILYNKNNYFDENGNFTLTPSEYAINENGDMILYPGNRLNFYETKAGGTTDYSIEFKKMYVMENNVLYVINGGTIVVPAQYKSLNSANGTLSIQKEFLDNNGNYFVFGNGGVTIPQGHYTLRQQVIQPQSAMVITDYKTGGIKAMAGGRGLSGKMLYNRAIKTRPPGSSIKPISVYGAAIQGGADGKTKWTAGSLIEDSANYVDGKLWPKNWYRDYKGWISLRTCIEQSVNIPSVRLLEDIGYDTAATFLKRLGVTSVTDSDYNSAALALGGMTNGISPIEISSAYGTFANGGVYVEPVTYTQITNSAGDVLLKKTPASEQVMDAGVAFIMTDILQTTVSKGIAGRAAIHSQPVGGKTGTTNNNYDAWFVGFTPQYSASLWIGNDVNLQLSQGSSAASSLWSSIMQQACKDLPRGSFQPMPDNVEWIKGEYYIKGTRTTGRYTEDIEIITDEEENTDSSPDEGENGSSDDIIVSDEGKIINENQNNTGSQNSGIIVDSAANQGSSGSGSGSGQDRSGGIAGNEIVVSEPVQNGIAID